MINGRGSFWAWNLQFGQEYWRGWKGTNTGFDGSVISGTNNDVPMTIVTAGATQDLTPGLVTDGDTFHAPTVTATNTLVPGLVDDADTFYAPTVTAGAVTLSPSLVTDGAVSYTHLTLPTNREV